MKYRFITILHNLKLEKRKNRGIEIFKGARISNGPEVLSSTLNTLLMKSTAGVHSIDEFKDSVYFYIDGEFEEIKTQQHMDEVGGMYTFFFLRQAQQFVAQLWQVKDNNVYVRDGFLINYYREIEDGRTFKASLSEIYTYSHNMKEDSNGVPLVSLFTDSEISAAVHDFSPFELNQMHETDGKYVSSDIFFKSSGFERVERAFYFTMNARKSPVLPMKIVFYCTALECLFTSGKSEINHKIAERVALMLGTNGEKKKELYDLVKKAYDTRSTVIHGSSLKGRDNDLSSISEGLDEVLRSLIKGNHEVFSKKDKEIDAFFVNLLFNNSTVE